MNILLRRIWYSDQSTTGCLYLDNIFECFTLEDVVREEKVMGQTAIPAGKYRVVIDDSWRFKRPMPHILDVPNFTGIRIHPGNTAYDTAGCILVGKDRGIDRIERSRMAFDAFFEKLKEALKTEEAWIDIQGPQYDESIL